MVFYYNSFEDPRFLVYMGRDKFENEDLIRFGWPEDVWFHVDDLSSAHVYLRLPEGMEWTEVPLKVMAEMAQLVKNNSIEGCKKDHVDVVYTPWSNLKKSGDMAVGQVGFKNPHLVKHIHRVAKDREIIRRIEKTKREANVNLDAERKARDRREVEQRKAKLQQQRAAEREDRERRAQEKALKSYASLYEVNSVSDVNVLKGDGTIESCRQLEEDFM